MSSEPFVFDDFSVGSRLADGVTASLWEEGWRHFGGQFFRYSHSIYAGELQHIVPVRIDLSRFKLSKSQRRVLNKNADLQCEWRPAEVNAELEALFEVHKERFTDNMPSDLYDFLSRAPDSFPCICEMFLVHSNGECVAASYCDLDGAAASAVYGMFAPEHSTRGLGIFTLLKEIERAIDEGRRWHYLGYATREASIYDYKKQFSGLEGFEWGSGQWEADPFRATTDSAKD